MLKGYVYTTGKEADPGLHNNMNDPLFSKTPTLGACMPNVRRSVTIGDYIFVVSGKTASVQQYVVGGFRVREKITALAAYNRFPENRLRMDSDGQLQGNIIVNPDGSKHPLDGHAEDTFDARIQNYIVGDAPVYLRTSKEIERGRAQTLDRLATILERPKANRVIDVMGRWSKLDEGQVNKMLDWLKSIKEPT